MRGQQPTERARFSCLCPGQNSASASLRQQRPGIVRHVVDHRSIGGKGTASRRCGKIQPGSVEISRSALVHGPPGSPGSCRRVATGSAASQAWRLLVKSGSHPHPPTQTPWYRTESRFVRKLASSRTATMERGFPKLIRSCCSMAGTLWPNVPPNPGVEVWPSTTKSSDPPT